MGLGLGLQLGLHLHLGLLQLGYRAAPGMGLGRAARSIAIRHQKIM
jgi:hypothetical protein